MLMGTVGADTRPVGIRRGTPDDAAVIAELNGQLGYPGTVDEVRRRDRKSTRLNSSHYGLSRMPSSA